MQIKAHRNRGMEHKNLGRTISRKRKKKKFHFHYQLKRINQTTFRKHFTGNVLLQLSTIFLNEYISVYITQLVKIVLANKIFRIQIYKSHWNIRKNLFLFFCSVIFNRKMHDIQ